MKTQISIIGCGWLGLPLGKVLTAKGYKIKGSTTTESKLKTLTNASIEGFLIRLDEDGIFGNYSEFLSESETIIINIPPGLRKNPNKNHVAEIMVLVKAIEEHKIKNVLYISSTSVFEDETDFPVIGAKTLPNATSNSSKQLIAIEEMLQKNPNFNTTIIRFGGLLDHQRHPAKYLAGKTNLSHPNAPVNLIHKEDCIEIIALVLQKQFWNKALNAAYPEHPSKKDYYIGYCKAHHLAVPEFNFSKKSKGKIIDSLELEQLLNYTFKQAL